MDILKIAQLQEIAALLAIIAMVAGFISFLRRKTSWSLTKAIRWPLDKLRSAYYLLLDWKNRRDDAEYGRFLALLALDLHIVNRIAQGFSSITVEPTSEQRMYWIASRCLREVIDGHDEFLERTCKDRRVSKHLRNSFLKSLEVLVSEMDHQSDFRKNQ